MGIITKTVSIVKTVRTVKKTKIVRKAHGPITVILPDRPAIPVPLRGTQYTVSKLLTDGEDNPKLAKSDNADTEYRTWGLMLSPAKQSGHQVCSSSSAGCRKECLNEQGRGRVFSTIHVGRIAKTVAFFQHRRAFLVLFRHELSRLAIRGKRQHFVPAVRLNVLSDLPWERLAPWIFTDYPEFQFYDYTKHASRMMRWCQGELPSNYHLTFSRSETNEADCLRVLDAGGTVAVVFATTAIPRTWHGYPVLNGDETDMRFADEPGHVVGLYAKGTAKHDGTGFVVPTRGVMSLATVN